MFKRLIFWFVMFGFSIFMALLVGELGIRVWGIMDASPDVNTVDTDQIDITFNKAGMRDRDFKYEKAPDVFRILVLGDSITFGVSVEADQTYVKQLETLSNERNENTHLEVINTGVPGWNTSYQQAFLEDKGILYKPDLVLIGFCLNDAEDNLPPSGFFLQNPPGISSDETLALNAEAWLKPLLEWRASVNWSPEAPSFSKHLKEYLISYSHFFRFIRWRYDILTRRIDQEDEYPKSLYAPNTKTWAQCRTALHNIKQTMSANNVPVVLAIFPLFIKLKKNEWFQDEGYPWHKIHTLLTATAQEMGITVVDLLPHFMNFDPRDISVDPYHPNVRGHRIAAEAIYDALIENQLLLRESVP